MKPMETLPADVSTLVKQLDRMFPEKCPSVTDGERDIWVYSGKRAVVRYLLRLLEESNN